MPIETANKKIQCNGCRIFEMLQEVLFNLWGFLLWTQSCRFKHTILSTMNLLLHCPHYCLFSPLWPNMCFLRVPPWVNFIEHCPHLCGFSPLWINMCFLRVPAWVNFIVHCPHLCGFSPLWINMCDLRLPDVLQD